MMKIEVYSAPNDAEGNAVKEFLIKTNIKFHEIIANDIIIAENSVGKVYRKKSIIKVTYAHSINV